MGRKRFTPFIVPNRHITGIAEDSKSVCRTDEGIVCFVEGAVPGDVADILIINKKKGFYSGLVHRLVTPSDERTQPACSHFPVCGGCKWQHFAYEGQLREKELKVHQAMLRIGKTTPKHFLPIMGCATPYFYRNKLEFTFSNKRWLSEEEITLREEIIKEPGLGFHRPGAFDKIVDISKCHLQKAPSNAIRNFVKAFTITREWPYYNIRTGEGFLRNLMIRTTSLDELMVLVSFKYEDELKIRELCDAILTEFPEITTLLYTINPKGNDTILDLECRIYYGPGYIIESLDDIKYKIGPKSFFQTNTAQTLNLYKQAIEFAAIRPGDIVYDLYTGLGSIALYIARYCQKVIGIENVAPAIEDAKENAQLNIIGNTTFITGNVEDVFTAEFINMHGQPDVIITDPPRAGMHAAAVQTLLHSNVPRIVYISCNPATLARDVQILSEKYDLEKLQAVDMFPQTNHVEAIGLLTLKEGG